MCSGLNFTKINQKTKKMLTSLFPRIGSPNVGTVQTATVAGGVRGESTLPVIKRGSKEKQ